MIKTFTQKDLIRFIYHETTEDEEKEIRKALLCDPILKTSYNELKETVRSMDQVNLEPNDEVVASILDYAKSTRTKKTKAKS